MCGDATIEKDVEKLLDGKEMDLLFTDPPYNINYSGVKDKRNIKNDKMDNKQFIFFLKKSLKHTSTAYVCCSWQNADIFKNVMTLNNMKPKAMIIWDKIIRIQNLDKYFKQYEIIFYYGKFGGEKTIRGDIWKCQREENTLHPTMKPIKLVSMALNDNPNDKYIYDPFAGSGSTLIASEKLNRNCFTMELDPQYCDKIIRRYYDYTFSHNIKLIRDGQEYGFDFIKKELNLLQGTTKKGEVSEQTRLF